MPPHGLPDALRARCDARIVYGPLGSSGRGGPVARDAVKPICKGCKRAQERADKPHRHLTRLPAEITQTVKFRRKAIPLYLCAFCDGPALKLAQETSAARSKKSNP